MKRIAELLDEAKRRGIDRLDVHVLLGHVLRRSRTWLLAHGDEPVDEPHRQAFDAVLARRLRGEPVAYLLGEKDFYGLPLAVDARVLVPRSDTELLVDWAIEAIHEAPDRPQRVIDLGTGSGAIAIGVKHACPCIQMLATDCSPGALEVASANAKRLGTDITWRSGSWWHAVDAGERFSLILSNPPYIAHGDPHLQALSSEPFDALVSGVDGLDALREIVAGAKAHLEPAGRLILEHGHDQGAPVRALLEAAGFTAVHTRRDLSGHERCTSARA